MRSLSSALSSALGAPVQQPALLVQMAFSTVRRWTSYDSLTWNGLAWTREAISVENLQVQALRVSGTLVIGNADDAIGALVLSEGVQDRAITIWGYDAAATATGDVVWLASAVGASAQVGLREVRIALRHRSEFMQAPRVFVGQAAGFNTLIPAGATLRLGGVDYTLERR